MAIGGLELAWLTRWSPENGKLAELPLATLPQITVAF
jgi:hypothetical protein